MARAVLAVRVLRAGQLAGGEEPDARSGAALQRHRSALQRAEQLLDVRSGRASIPRRRLRSWPATVRSSPGTGSPTNGIVIFGEGFPDAAHGVIPAADDPAAQALFAGLPRGGVLDRVREHRPAPGLRVHIFGEEPHRDPRRLRHLLRPRAHRLPQRHGRQPSVRSVGDDLRRQHRQPDRRHAARVSAEHRRHPQRDADAAGHVLQPRRAARDLSRHDPARQLRRHARQVPDADGEHQPASAGHAAQPAGQHDQRQRAEAVPRLRQHPRSPRTPTSRAITACSCR